MYFSSFVFPASLPRSNLSNNRITDIEEGTFEGASGVNELILTSNRLENIHHRMLKGLGGLRTLWVHTQAALGSNRLHVIECEGINVSVLLRLC